jgi:peptidoglycan/LPS O-acetylase OafA/YrhL
MLFVIFQVWGPSSPVLAVVCYFAFTPLASVVAFRLIESPMINLGRRLTEHGYRGGTAASRLRR